MKDIKLILVDPNHPLCAAFQEYFSEWTYIEVINSYFEKSQTFDCMVNAANSFGLMDGGVDLAIIRFFGHDLMAKVQQHILKNYYQAKIHYGGDLGFGAPLPH